jgi:hypothetical protein
MRDVDAESIAERFGLGRPLGEPVVAAAGWGDRNRVWRLETTTGVFAGGVLDIDVALGFLRGYLDGGGVVECDDVAALPLWLIGVTWWTERNVQIAITEPSEHHDQLATLLVDALAQGVATVRRRQLFFNAVLAQL